MVPTFVIGLREGLEAALIVGIIAAFLRRQARADLMGWLFAGVAAAVLLCVAVGVALDVVSRDLPQRQQEGLETVVGVLAVGMVTYMVLWMRRHSRELKGQLEDLAADAIASGGGATAARAMVLMAFLAVLREGFETVVFLLAAFNESADRTTAVSGAVLGIAVAVVLGYGIYRGGVRINLARFFRATGIVLVVVAAGLVMSALHTAHEAGWLQLGQAEALNLTRYPVIGWLLRAGSVQASLVTGMLGIQPRPTVIEAVGWLVYLVPVGLFVAWPAGREVPLRRFARVALAVGCASLAGAVVLTFAVPDPVTARPTTASAQLTARVVSANAHHAVVRTQPLRVDADGHTIMAAATDIAVSARDLARHDGLVTTRYSATFTGTGAGRPATLPVATLTRLGGGRLPLGVRPGDRSSLPVRYAEQRTLEVWVTGGAQRIVDLRWTDVVAVDIEAPGIGTVPVDAPITSTGVALATPARASAVARANSDTARQQRRDTRQAQSRLALVLGALLLLAAAAFELVALRKGPRPRHAAATGAPVAAELG
ncbi:MAG TPA: iron uptake transporter permease EfeU [Acidimicrobiia bacterium]|jgi:high-affinity iron transporter